MISLETHSRKAFRWLHPEFYLLFSLLLCHSPDVFLCCFAHFFYVTGGLPFTDTFSALRSFCLIICVASFTIVILLACPYQLFWVSLPHLTFYNDSFLKSLYGMFMSCPGVSYCSHHITKDWMVNDDKVCCECTTEWTAWDPWREKSCLLCSLFYTVLIWPFFYLIHCIEKQA